VGHRHVTGQAGERLASRKLEEEGWTVLSRRWRDGTRELDLVAVREGVLAFVEVKTRRRGTPHEVLASVTPRKRREVELAAGAWLRRYRSGAGAGDGELDPGPIRRIRFDVVAVALPPGRPPALLHVEGAWIREDRSRGERRAGGARRPSSR
jgi:putative endonuclease